MNLTSGDVLEIACENGYAYLVYIGRHDRLGDSVRVIPTIFSEKQLDLDALAQLPGYVVFYPAASALRSRLIKRTGHCSLGLGSVPVWVRSAVNVDADGTVKSWLVTDGAEKIPRRLLSDAELDMPIASIWNHRLLLHRLATGWSPRDGYLGVR